MLLDSLNTKRNDQTFVRGQLVNFFRNAHPGANIAIFGLSLKLFMIQGFTTDLELLNSVADRLGGRPSPLLVKNPSPTVTSFGPPTVRSQNEAPTTSAESAGIEQYATFFNGQDTVEADIRALYTLDALNLLARYLSTIPGRKNLIWFSGGFPLNILPDTDNSTDDPFLGMSSIDLEYRGTAKMFADSRVAVYPVDARGLRIGSGNPVTDMKDADAAFVNMQMANDTGGRAFVNTNGLADAVDTAIESGSNYYTIAYRPSNPGETGKFRKTEVTLAQSGYNLEYRRGYYETDERSGRKQTQYTADISDGSKAAIFRAMEHGVPSSAEVLFKARVIPAAAPAAGPRHSLKPNDSLQRYSVDFAVLPTDIAYTTTPDGNRHFEIEFITAAYRSDGAMANRTANYLHGSLTPAQFTAMQQTGFPFHHEINVPVSGKYYLRVGVHDLTNDHIGVTEFPVSSVGNLPPEAHP